MSMPPSNEPTQNPQPPSVQPPQNPNVNMNAPAVPAGQQLSNSPFAKMFPSGATTEELQQFINNFLKMMIFQFKQSDESWKKAMDHLKRVEEGKDD